MKSVSVNLVVVLDVNTKQEVTGEEIADELRRAVEEEISELWPTDDACYDVRFASVLSFGTVKPLASKA